MMSHYRDETDAWAILGVQGPTAHELIGRVVGRISADLPEHHTVIREFDGTPIWVTARSYTGEPGCDLRIAQNRADSLRQALVTGGRNANRIASGGNIAG